MAATLRTFLLAVGLSAAALHGQEDMLTPEQFVKVHGLADANKDGKLSMQELLDFSQKTRSIAFGKDINTVLTEMDENKDGKLSFDELQASDPGGSDQMEGEEKKEEEKRMALEKMKFEAADLDRDGLLTTDELVGLFYPEQNNEVLKIISQDTLSLKDTDKDGHLSPSEFWEGDIATDEAGKIADEELKEFKLLDKDGDGRMNVEELMHWESGHHHTKAAMDQLLATADKNSDGHLTTEELTGARDELAGTDAGYHFLEWAEHHEL
eukprot:TRINITY_DN1805_c0_g1_i2.p1 TRINITY_DN1805_c0_g1~~TRINITY_DN1805_c0_g1_i2.p1  ORF type:complete len:267 (-),score=94.39 TRINITY_DN1805_c0_g1_i2:42-842(-)